ncbi:MAG TPA: major capsid protein [Polyangiaceae bacterium]|nr:major capsid protein [Polyangiaceae bacterium]
MSDATTSTMLRPFVEKAPEPMFLSGFFQTPPENFYMSEDVEIDIQRDGEDVAIAIIDLATGARHNENSKGSNKKFTPPIFKEKGSLNAFQLLSREPGQHPFQSVAWVAKALQRVGLMSGKLTGKVRRAIELMCSQALQTGTVTCTDENGLAVYTIDFQPKNAHFVTTTPWAADGTGGNRRADIDGLARTIRKNGHRSPDTLILGNTAQERLVADDEIKELLKADGFYSGRAGLVPERPGVDGANFLGTITINNYRYALWGYDGRYNDPQTGESLPYVDDDKIIMLSSKARLDLTFGGIPRVAPPDGRALPFMPARASAPGLDMHPNAWLSEDGETLQVSVASRPLPVATEIDSFGCLDVA